MVTWFGYLRAMKQKSVSLNQRTAEQAHQLSGIGAVTVLGQMVIF